MRNFVAFALTLAACAAAGCGPAVAAQPLTGTSWQLTSIESTAPEEQPSIIIDTPARYTLEFGDDGRATFTVDCNRGNATWQVEPAADSGGLTFGPLALTRMSCPQPSQYTKVVGALSRVRSYLLSEGLLHLSLEADSGIMHWRPAP